MRELDFRIDDFEEPVSSAIEHTGKTLTAELTSRRFLSADASFAIWNGTSDNGEGVLTPVSLKGGLARCNVGDTVVCHGYWTNHRLYGWGFTVESYEEDLPQTEGGLLVWLQKLPGVGPVVAKAIINHFGAEHVVEELDEDPTLLHDVLLEGGRTIHASVVENIIEAWEERRDTRSIELFLASLGVGAAVAAKLFKQYGTNVGQVMREDPYQIVEIHGIGFKMADEFAIKGGMELDDERRVRAGILHVLMEASREGHTFLSRDDLIHRVSAPTDARYKRDQGLGVSDMVSIDRSIERLIQDVVLVQDGEGIYLRGFYLMEVMVASRIRKMIDITEKAIFGDHEPVEIEGNQPDETQWGVVEQVSQHHLSLLTGGPGCGKTFTQRVIIRQAERAGLTVKLCAPTGKAARRMSELSGGHEATTIHRLLGFTDGQFTHNDEFPLDVDLLIVDESSMLSLDLARSLLRAVPEHAHVLLVGDPDQLPPVGVGRLLSDLIDSGLVPRVHLSRVYRQAQRSLITVNANRVNHGDMPYKDPTVGRETLGWDVLDDFFLIEAKAEKIAATIMKMACERIPAIYGLDPIRDVMVLAPMHAGPAGITALNESLEERLNPGEKRWVTRGIAVGSRIVQTKNDYVTEIMNGEVAFVANFERETGQVQLLLDDREQWVNVDQMSDFKLAWAMSIHKSQGSEFKAVIVPIAMSHRIMLRRSLIYTAITRGVDLTIVVGEEKALRIAVRNSSMEQRNSTLIQRLSQTNEEEVHHA